MVDEELLRRKFPEYLQVLQTRFNHITGLRTMTAQRHMALIAGAIAGLTGLGQFGKTDTVTHLLMPVATTLLVLSCCVTVYDAMMRVRAEAVVIEIENVKSVIDVPENKITEAEGSHHFLKCYKHFGEDFFFFSQILIVSGLSAIPLGGIEGLLSSAGTETNLKFGWWPHGAYYFLTVLSLSFLWLITSWSYKKWGPPANWAPIAYPS